MQRQEQRQEHRQEQSQYNRQEMNLPPVSASSFNSNFQMPQMPQMAPMAPMAGMAGLPQMPQMPQMTNFYAAGSRSLGGGGGHDPFAALFNSAGSTAGSATNGQAGTTVNEHFSSASNTPAQIHQESRSFGQFSQTGQLTQSSFSSGFGFPQTINAAAPGATNSKYINKKDFHYHKIQRTL